MHLNGILEFGVYVSLLLLVILAWIMLRNAKLYYSSSKYIHAFACGVVGVAFLLLPVMALLLPVICAGRNVHGRSSCMNNLSQIGRALSMYSMDHNEQYPHDLQTLAVEMKLSPKLFVCPESKHVAGSLSNLNEWTEYVYVSTSSPTNDANTPIVFEGLANHDGKGANILYNDGSVCWLNYPEYRRSIQKFLPKSAKFIGGAGSRF